jgi:uncharacterized protein (TIGR00251 family)
LIALTPHAGGVILPVKAQPGSRNRGIRGEHAGALKVCVTEAAEKGKANKAIIAVLAEQLQLKKHQLTLVTGQTTSQKRILVREMSLETLRERIEAVLAQV